MSVEATESIANLRSEIDVLDERIISLLEQRTAFSLQVQRTRMREGGDRLASEREQWIVQRYADRLGDRGAQLAGLVLEMCRGNTRRAR
ncbi:chorismate mutase [Streptomyces sp. B1I3]|uniref:chorismate mutase n=1 Tax=Streptomyces sp. B1I3 TaxID=3042264 RepID=UPI0027814092|nr:chorismate mutase [Streptomyces sp. B1I3]MDQ0794216.1 chorismate mutase [Streptomyces sp. B1I3]